MKGQREKRGKGKIEKIISPRGKNALKYHTIRLFSLGSLNRIYILYTLEKGILKGGGKCTIYTLVMLTICFEYLPSGLESLDPVNLLAKDLFSVFKPDPNYFLI